MSNYESFILDDEGKFVPKNSENDPMNKSESYTTEAEFKQKAHEYKAAGWVVLEERDGYIKFENQFPKLMDTTTHMMNTNLPQTIELNLVSSEVEKPELEEAS